MRSLRDAEERERSKRIAEQYPIRWPVPQLTLPGSSSPLNSVRNEKVEPKNSEDIHQIRRSNLNIGCRISAAKGRPFSIQNVKSFKKALRDRRRTIQTTKPMHKKSIKCTAVTSDVADKLAKAGPSTSGHFKHEHAPRQMKAPAGFSFPHATGIAQSDDEFYSPVLLIH